MFLKILGWIPLIQCLTYFPRETHKPAIRKFIVLLLLTSSPIILAAFLSPMPTGDEDILPKLWSKLKETITVSELFVYTASFLTPILYLIYEKYSAIPKHDLGDRITQGVKGIFKGYGFVALLSTFLMFATAIGFSSLKVHDSAFKDSFLYYYLVKYSAWIYLFTLFCWYLTLLEEANNSSTYVEQNRSSELAFSNAFSERIKERGVK